MVTKPIERLSMGQWDSLVSSIYEAALNPAHWDDALLAIGKPMNAHAGHLVILPGGSTFTHYDKIVGLDPCVYAQSDEYLRNGLNPRVAAAQNLPAMSFINDYMHITEAEMKRNVFYQKLAKEHDMGYYGGFILQNSLGCFVGIGVLRSRRFGHLTDLESQLLMRLMPHLRRSIELMQLLPHKGLLLGLSEALENHPAGAVVIDSQGAIVSMNTKAQAILTRGDGLYETDRMLHAVNGHAQKQLHSEIKLLISATDYLSMSGTGHIPVPRTESVSPYILFVTPIKNPEDPFQQIAGVVFIMDPEERLPDMQLQLMEIYELTSAEATLVQGLCEGKTLNVIAVEQAVSVEAPRFHLKNVFSKVGVKRQTELIRTVLRGLAKLQ
jgi:DNA-binding CsgD family transcriptional regulator/PAS domain-containing protein